MLNQRKITIKIFEEPWILKFWQKKNLSESISL